MAQRSLLSYNGFKRAVSFRGQQVEVAAPKFARKEEPPKVKCRTCDKLFKTPQARSQHEVWSHPLPNTDSMPPALIFPDIVEVTQQQPLRKQGAS